MSICRDCGLDYEREGGRRSCDDCVAPRASGHCLDCGERIERGAGRRGPLPRRCPSCIGKHKGRQSYRYTKQRIATDPAYAEQERERRRVQMAEWRAANPDHRRRLDREAKARAYADPVKRERIRLNAKLGRIARNYGMTRAEYEALIDQFGGACAICQTKGDDVVLCVDHCHESLKVRGLLCQGCNIGLGGFRDDPVKLRGAIRYLSRYG